MTPDDITLKAMSEVAEVDRVLPLVGNMAVFLRYVV